MSDEQKPWRPSRPYGYGGGEEAETKIAQLQAELKRLQEENERLRADYGDLERGIEMNERVLIEKAQLADWMRQRLDRGGRITACVEYVARYDALSQEER